MQDYEILGHFYLGKIVDPQTMTKSEQYLLYDSKDLATHAICIGMTGSGKTGLGISILEEAAIDNIPALILDPKGDMGNLLLTFPELKPEDFLPWLQASDAERKGITIEEYAKSKAQEWQDGLKAWDQDGNRIRYLKSKSEFSIYTPGSSVGNPLSIIQMLNCPSDKILNNSELLNDYAASNVSSLLSLIGIDADPLQSKEHILLSNILLKAWQKGEDVDLTLLIQYILQPQIEKIGIMPLEKFFPENERLSLATSFNNLLAAPQFSAWLQGVPLNIQNLLYTADGKARMSVISLNHLNDTEKMFFVSLFLNQILAWMRTQAGTSSLRAILYMDEIFGFVPPVSNPPSKKPMLALLKQARAFGLGIILATQNPVDIDYKGLSNIGTWFIGRLQTEQDKNKLLDGLQMASQNNNSSALFYDRQALSDLLSRLPTRSFILNNIHEAGPVLFETRHTLSYLAGPLNSQQISALQDSQPKKADQANLEKNTQLDDLKMNTLHKNNLELKSEAQTAVLPNLPGDIRQYYFPANINANSVTYKPTLFAHVEVTYENMKPAIFKTASSNWQAIIEDSIIPVNWDNAKLEDFDLNDLQTQPQVNAKYYALPEIATKKPAYTNWQKELIDYIYRNESFVLFSNPEKSIISEPEESQAEFLIRLRQTNHELRDAKIEELRKKYDKKLAALNEKIRKAEQTVQREKDQAEQAKFSTFINVGSTLLDTLVGRKGVGKTTVNKAARSIQSAGRSKQQLGDVDRAEESLLTYQKDLENLEAELEQEIIALTDLYTEKEEAYQELQIKPKKKDILVKVFALLWQPVME